MKISRLYVDNFKAALDVELELSHMTALVGANGSGKTTFLEALDYFFRPADIPHEAYNDPSKEIRIAVTFTRLPQSNKPVTVTRTCRWDGEETTVETEDTSYKLSAYENILGSVIVLFERAEHETDDDGTKKSDLALADMIKERVRKKIEAADLDALFASSREYYQTLRDSLDEYKSAMNKKLAGGEVDPTGYAPGSSIDFVIEPNPEPDIRTVFVEPDRQLEHKLAGHGTKRAYHMAALEAHAKFSSEGDGQLVLMLVDEPELHQHPQRQRHILQTYKQLAGKPSFQIVYSTHSPELVDLDRPEGIYRVTRVPGSGIKASPGSGQAPKLSSRTIHKNLVEGIFSAGVILVEGWRDEAVLSAALSVVKMGEKSVMKKLIEGGINIIYATSVTRVPDFARFFRTMGVPVFAVWDADGNASGDDQNKDILAALGSEAEFEADKSYGGRHIGTGFLCFARDTDLYFKDWLGFPGDAETKEQKKAIKDVIGDHEYLARAFDTEEFRGAEFATEIVPHICSHFSLP